MSVPMQKFCSLLTLVTASLIVGCDEEPEAWSEGPEQEIQARDLSLCATVPAHATVTLAGSGTYSEHAPNTVMTQTGCDNRFVVDFDKSGIGAVQISDDLHHSFSTSESWPYSTESACISAHAVMDVYTLGFPYISFTKLGTYEFSGEWEDGDCTPVELEGQTLPLIPTSVATIRLATRAWKTGGVLPIIPTWARATVVVP